MQGGAPVSPADATARLAALEDREAIRGLIGSYGPLVDSGRVAEAALLWAEDGVYEVGGYGEYVGPAAIQALLEGPDHQGLIAGGAAHVLTPPVIALTGDTAVAHTYSVVFRKAGAAWEPYRAAANEWQLRRTPAGWRVVRRINRLLDGAAEARELIGRAGG
jgi:hypothetical protein